MVRSVFRWIPSGGLRTRRAERLSFVLAGLLVAAAPPLFGDFKPPQARLAGARVAGEEVERDLLDLAAQHCAAHFSSLSPKTCMESVWAPRWRMEAAARERGLNRTPHFRFDEKDLLHRALVEQIGRETPEPLDSEVFSFLERNAREFHRPLRLRLFRILVASEEEARGLLANLPKPLTLESFRALARAHSVDRATNERGGDLGFVWPDGSTDVPQVRVDAHLYEAALALDDGAWSKEPVQEGTRFAVLWRRGSLAPVSLRGDAHELARLRLREKRTAAAVDKVLARLLEQQVRDRADILLGKLRRNETGMFHEPSL